MPTIHEVDKIVPPSGGFTHKELKHLGRKSECPSAWPWAILGATLGITLYHFFVLPVIL